MINNGGDIVEKVKIRQQRDNKEKTRINLTLPWDLKIKILEIAKQKNQSIALTIRELLEKALEGVQ